VKIADVLEMPPTITVEETAAILGTGRSATYAAIKSGQIPAIRVGRKLRIPTGHLIALLGIDPHNGLVARLGDGDA